MDVIQHLFFVKMLWGTNVISKDSSLAQKQAVTQFIQWGMMWYITKIFMIVCSSFTGGNQFSSKWAIHFQNISICVQTTINILTFCSLGNVLQVWTFSLPLCSVNPLFLIVLINFQTFISVGFKPILTASCWSNCSRRSCQSIETIPDYNSETA